MPTALELTRDGWKGYLKGAKRRLTVPKLTATQKRKRGLLLRRVRKAAAVLKEQFGARRVILFGSFAGAGRYMATSDVDLAVEGLKGGKSYWQAWRIVEEIVEDHLVDLIEMEDAAESLRQAIRRYGINL